MEISTKMFKEWDYWYDERWKGKKREVKTALKDYKKEIWWEESCSRYCSCKKEYVKLLEEKKQGWEEKKSTNYLIKHKIYRKLGWKW